MITLQYNSTKYSAFSIDRGFSNLLKFVSAILIAFHHYAQYVVIQPVAPRFEIFWWILSYQCGYIGVAVFFFLSGYGLMQSDLKEHLSVTLFLNKRIKRIIFPLVVLAGIWIPLYYYFDFSYPKAVDNLAQIIIRTLDVGGWFVTAILIMYAVFITFSEILHRVGCESAVKFLTLGTIMAYIFCDQLLGSYTSLSIPIFSVGIIASLYKEKYYLGYYNFSLIYLSVFCVFSIVYCFIVCHSGALAIHSIINYFLIGILILTITISSPSIAFPALLGEISFDIYLIHKKIITANFALNDNLIDCLLWIILTFLFVSAFVYMRKTLGKFIFHGTC